MTQGKVPALGSRTPGMRPAGRGARVLWLGLWPALAALSAAHALESVGAAAPTSLEIEVAPEAWPARAQAGEWVRLRTRVPWGGDRGVEVVQELRVGSVQEDARGRLITVFVSCASGGNQDTALQRFRVAPAPAQAAPAPSPEGEGPLAAREKDAGKATLTVSGKALKCKVRERIEKNGAEESVVKTWSSPGAPYGGAVRIEHDGKVVFELLDFGKNP